MQAKSFSVSYGSLAVQRRVDRERGDGVQEGMAVRWSLGGELGGDRRAPAWTVFHDDLLAPALRELFRQHAGEYVGLAAGGQRHDVAHGAGREALRARVLG